MSKKKGQLSPVFTLICCILGAIYVVMRITHEDIIKDVLIENESPYIFIESSSGLPMMPNAYPYNGFSVYLPKGEFYSGMIVENSSTIKDSSVSSALKSIGVRGTSRRRGRTREHIFDVSVMAVKTGSHSECKNLANERVRKISEILNKRLTSGNEVMINGDSTWYLKPIGGVSSLHGYSIGYHCKNEILYLIVVR